MIEHSGAPRVSIYHHLPDAKAQLVEEAMRYAGGYVADSLGDTTATIGQPARKSLRSSCLSQELEAMLTSALGR